MLLAVFATFSLLQPLHSLITSPQGLLRGNYPTKFTPQESLNFWFVLKMADILHYN